MRPQDWEGSRDFTATAARAGRWQHGGGSTGWGGEGARVFRKFRAAHVRRRRVYRSRLKPGGEGLLCEPTMCSRADILESADSENGTGTSIITVPVKITPRGPQRHCRHSDNYTKEDIGYRIQIFDTEQKRGYRI